MKSIAFLVLVSTVGIGIIGLVEATNYCASAVSCNSSPGTNIGCNNTGAFVSTCPAGRKMVNMTASLRAAITKRHNYHRNRLAAGDMPKFNSSVRMATMRWSSELANLAALNVKRCIFEHDACHNTNKFLYSGQNIAETSWSGGTPPTNIAVILPQIDAWWSEYKDTTMADINSYPTSPSAVIGHFTVLTAAKNIAVGCAGARFKDPAVSNWSSLLFTCNYARTNIVGARFYVSGTTASQCSTGTNPNFPALCSIDEKFNVNVV